MTTTTRAIFVTLTESQGSSTVTRDDGEHLGYVGSIRMCGVKRWWWSGSEFYVDDVERAVRNLLVSQGLRLYRIRS